MTLYEKQCTKCNQTKPIAEFNKQAKTKDGYQTYCRPCQSEISKDWYKENPSKNYLQKYGITVEDKDEMAKAQGDRCAICKEPLADAVTICVDHCHESDQIRGILCHHCNIGLGHFKDSPKLLQQAIYYLDYHAKKIAASSVSTGDHQQGQDDPQHGTLLATWTGQDDNHPDHHSGAIPGQDLDHCAQTGSGDSMGHRGKEVAASEPFTRIEDHGQPDAEIVRLEFGRRDLFD
jgi:hypothetical protein